MRFDIITLFPELFAPFLASGVTRRAYASGQVDVRLWNPRDYADGNYRRVDDRPFGGGPGMVMMAEPLARCLAAIRAERGEHEGGEAPLVLFSPIGESLNHAAVERWSASEGAVLLCGRYEGIDQRFIDTHVNVQMSLGDFVLSGGEIAAMALLDAVARLQPGCSTTRAATSSTASIPRSMACWTARITRGPKSGQGIRCLRPSCRVTMRRSSAGGVISAWPPRPATGLISSMPRAKRGVWHPPMKPYWPSSAELL